MQVERIAAHETDFDQRGEDGVGKFHRLANKRIAIPGSSDFMAYTEARPASGDESYYYRSRAAKDQIVLHFTMGYLKGDVATLTTPDNHVSVPFVIGRNGTIYNLFPSFYWSYHLGPGAVGGNQARSRASIGIELSNIGPLKAVNGNLATVYSDSDVYCRRDQNEYYRGHEFRNYHYFASFTDAQYASLIVLLRYLTARYGIPRQFLPAADRYETDTGTPGFHGIVSHVNYRRRGKVDIGPAFNWVRVIDGLSA